MKGVKLNNQFESIFSLYNLPQNSINDLYLYLKNNLNRNKKASYSKSYNNLFNNKLFIYYRIFFIAFEKIC